MIGRHVPPVYSPLGPAALARGLWATASGGRDEERELVTRLRTRYGTADVLLTDSGTGALTLALRAVAQAKSGIAGATRAAVALPAYCCYDIATAADGADVDVLLYDVDPLTLAPEESSLHRALAREPRAVVVAHLFGLAAATDRVQAAVADAGAVLIEDAAQAEGGVYHGRPLGTAGSLALLSFGRGKGRTGSGGGALMANDAAGQQLLARVRQDRGRPAGSGRALLTGAAQTLLARPTLYALPAALPFLGLGETVYRPAAPVRAIAAGSLGLLLGGWSASDVEAAARRRRGELWVNALTRGGILTPIRPPDDAVAGYLRLPALMERRAERLDGAARQLGVMPGYPAVLADLPGFGARVLNRDEPWDGARRLVAELISLPTHSRMSVGDVARLGQWLAGLRVDQRETDVAPSTAR